MQNSEMASSFVRFGQVSRNRLQDLLKCTIGSKSLNQCKMVGVKFFDLFLLTEWFERNFSYLSIV